MHTVTNNQPRLLIDGYTLPPVLFAKGGDFDYTTADQFVGFRYRSALYDLNDFMAIDDPDWDAGHAATMFSAVVIRLLDDDPDRIIVGSQFN